MSSRPDLILLRWWATSGKGRPPLQFAFRLPHFPHSKRNSTFSTNSSRTALSRSLFSENKTSSSIWERARIVSASSFGSTMDCVVFFPQLNHIRGENCESNSCSATRSAIEGAAKRTGHEPRRSRLKVETAPHYDFSIGARVVHRQSCFAGPTCSRAWC